MSFPKLRKSTIVALARQEMIVISSTMDATLSNLLIRILCLLHLANVCIYAYACDLIHDIVAKV